MISRLREFNVGTLAGWVGRSALWVHAFPASSLFATPSSQVFSLLDFILIGCQAFPQNNSFLTRCLDPLLQ